MGPSVAVAAWILRHEPTLMALAPVDRGMGSSYWLVSTLHWCPSAVKEVRDVVASQGRPSKIGRGSRINKNP